MSAASRPVTRRQTNETLKNARAIKGQCGTDTESICIHATTISIIKIRKWPVSANDHFLFHSSVVTWVDANYGMDARAASYCPFSIHFSDNLSSLPPFAGVSIDIFFFLPTRISILFILDPSFLPSFHEKMKRDSSLLFSFFLFFLRVAYFEVCFLQVFVPRRNVVSPERIIK